MIPEVVDIGGFITVTIGALASVVLVVIGGFFSFMIVKKCFKWGKHLDASECSFGDKDYDCSPEDYEEMKKYFYGKK